MSWRGANGLYVARKLGLTANLIYILDVGDAASYDGSAQTIADLSGNSNTFNLGATSGSEASDPTFNGTAGRLSKDEYFSLDGGDYLKAASVPTEIQNFHTADGIGTIAGWWYYVASGARQLIASSQTGGSTSIGVALRIAETTSNLLFTQGNGAGGGFGNGTGISMDTAVGGGNWFFAGVAFDVVGNSLISRVNSAVGAATATYSSPTESAAAGYAIGAGNNGGQVMPSGSRIGPQWAWSRQLSAGELAALFDATRGRFQV